MSPTTLLFSKIGNISLNISFLIYLFVYLPQLLHNQKKNNIAELSLSLHGLLFLSYTSDLIYGFSDHLPWQYKTVSIVGLSLVFVQHIQLSKYFIKQGLLALIKLSVFIFISNYTLIFCFIVIQHGALNAYSTLAVGTIARISGLLYCLPQIIKNRILKSAQAISLHYIYLSLLLTILDTISAWCLDWGWPNKLASPISMLLMLTLLYQTKKYRHKSYGFNSNNGARLSIT